MYHLSLPLKFLHSPSSTKSRNSIGSSRIVIPVSSTRRTLDHQVIKSIFLMVILFTFSRRLNRTNWTVHLNPRPQAEYKQPWKPSIHFSLSRQLLHFGRTVHVWKRQSPCISIFVVLSPVQLNYKSGVAFLGKELPSLSSNQLRSSN